MTRGDLGSTPRLRITLNSEAVLTRSRLVYCNHVVRSSLKILGARIRDKNVSDCVSESETEKDNTRENAKSVITGNSDSDSYKNMLEKHEICLTN